MAGWSPGNQSAGPNPLVICAWVKLSVLPGICFIDGSGAGAGVAGAPGAGAGAAAGIAYAHGGGPPAARSAPAAKSGAAPRTTSQMNLRIHVSIVSYRSMRPGYTPRPPGPPRLVWGIAS